MEYKLSLQEQEGEGSLDGFSQIEDAGETDNKSGGYFDDI